MIPPKCQCQDCADRYVGCHSECEKYQEFVKAREEFNTYIRQQEESDHMYLSYVSNLHIKPKQERR